MLDTIFSFLEDQRFQTITDECNRTYIIQEELLFYDHRTGDIKGLKYIATDTKGNRHLFFVDADRIETMVLVSPREVIINFKPNAFYSNIFRK